MYDTEDLRDKDGGSKRRTQKRRSIDTMESITWIGLEKRRTKLGGMMANGV